MGTVYTGLNLIARDPEATLAFYRLLGVDIPDSAVWSSDTGIHHVTVHSKAEAEFEIDSEALAAEYNAGFDPGSPRCLLGFKVETRDEVDALHAKLALAGHKSLQPPADAFWGSRFAIVEDPDGHPVGFMSPADPERQSAPPEV